MQWNDIAILISVRKHGETSAIIRVLSHEHGVHAGVVKGINSKANRGIFQPGNLLNVTWKARLSEHIGMFKAELQEASTAYIMQDATRLAALSSACSMVELSLPERHPYHRLYEIFIEFINSLKHDENWHKSYVKLELDLLAESGFGLDLSSCVATGKTDDLIYVSPKSGRAVSSDAGEPYKDKLLPLPDFLLPDNEPSLKSPLVSNYIKMQETLAGLRLSGYFLEHWLLEPHNRKMPAARQRFIDFMKAHNVENKKASC